MSTASDNTNQPNENHRAALDEMLGNTPTPPVTPPPVSETPPVTPVPAPAPETPPVVVPPVVTPPIENPPAPVTPPVNIYESLSEISNGLIKTEDDFKSTIQKVGQYADLESKHSALTQELEAAKNVKPFANEYLEKLNGLYQSGATPAQIQTFQQINSLGDLTALGSKESIKWELRQKHGITDQEAEAFLATKYKTDDTLYSADEIAASNVQMKIDSDASKAYLKTLQASFDTPAPANVEPVETPEQIATRERAYDAQLNPVVQTIEQELPGYFSKVNVNGQQGDKAITVDLPVPQETQQFISQKVKEFAKINDIDLADAGNVENLKAYAKNVTVMKMWPTWAIDIASKREEAVRAEFHNPDTISRGIPNPNASIKTSREAAASKVAAEM